MWKFKANGMQQKFSTGFCRSDPLNFRRRAAELLVVLQCYSDIYYADWIANANTLRHSHFTVSVTPLYVMFEWFRKGSATDHRPVWFSQPLSTWLGTDFLQRRYMAGRSSAEASQMGKPVCLQWDDLCFFPPKYNVICYECWGGFLKWTWH